MSATSSSSTTSRDPTRAAGSLALVDAGTAHRGRRDADLAGPAAPAASRAALRQRDVGELLARRLPGRRHLRPVEAENGWQLQLSSAVPGADAHRDAAAGRASAAGALRSRSTRRTRPRARSEEEARRGRAHACILTFDVTDLGAIKPLGQFQVSELDSPFSRTPGARFGAHQFCERDGGHHRARGLVRRRLAHHRRRRSAEPARGRPLHPGAGGGQVARRRATTSRSTTAASSTSSIATSASTCWSLQDESQFLNPNRILSIDYLRWPPISALEARPIAPSRW